MQHDHRILILLNKYTANLCTDGELDELFQHINTGLYDHIVSDHIMCSLQSEQMTGANMEAYRSQDIVQKILSAPHENAAIIRKISRKSIFNRIAVAAAVLVCMSVAAWWLLTNSGNNDLLPAKDMVQKDGKKIVNASGRAMLVQLEDGSRITLQPAAVLTYPKHFSIDKREVTLEGDAFFDIAKNPERPFYVYHQQLVTRVLGTSFYIRYNPQKNETEVEVSTGKVEVYEHVKKVQHNKSNGVIITPNQKVLYAEAKRLFCTSLVDEPLPIMNKDETGRLVPNATVSFEFEREPLSAIIPLLKQTYGIDIELENEDLNNCLFSGDISEQNLYSKLDILCQAIGITYEPKGTRILLKGRGCKN